MAGHIQTFVNLILTIFFPSGYFHIQKQMNTDMLSSKKLVEEFPDTPSPRYSTKKRKKRDSTEDASDPVDRTGTNNVFLNRWTKEGQEKYNELMKKIRDDQADYGAAFDANFMKFCKQMEENTLQKQPKKKKPSESVHIYSEHDILTRDTENLTPEVMSQSKTQTSRYSNGNVIHWISILSDTVAYWLLL